MPKAMVCPQSVTIEGILYVNERGGRYSDINRCDLHSRQWMEPLHYQHRCYGMTTVSSQLVMVGGRDVSTLKMTKAVGVCSPSERSWKLP